MVDEQGWFDDNGDLLLIGDRVQINGSFESVICRDEKGELCVENWPTDEIMESVEKL